MSVHRNFTKENLLENIQIQDAESPYIVDEYTRVNLLENPINNNKQLNRHMVRRVLFKSEEFKGCFAIDVTHENRKQPLKSEIDFGINEIERLTKTTEKEFAQQKDQYFVDNPNTTGEWIDTSNEVFKEGGNKQ